MNPRLTAILIIAVTAAIFVLAATSAYSAWVASTQHRNSCTSRDLTLDTLHDVIVLALTPQSGKTFTSKQVAAVQAFESKAFARIDQARC